MRPVLLSVATINLFTFAFMALFILYASTELGVNAGALGLTLGVGALGSIAGALVASRLGRRMGLGPAYALGCVLFPASLLLIPLAAPGMPMPLILALLGLAEFGAGFGVMVLDINVGSVMTARVPDRIRSRAAGSFRFVNYGIRPVGALLGGALGTAIGVREALWATAIASLFGVLFLVGTRDPSSARPSRGGRLTTDHLGVRTGMRRCDAATTPAASGGRRGSGPCPSWCDRSPSCRRTGSRARR